MVLVVTQPDRPRDRGGKGVKPSPVKEVAQELDIPVAQPERVATPEFVDQLEGPGSRCYRGGGLWPEDPDEILQLGRYGCDQCPWVAVAEVSGGRLPSNGPSWKGEKTTE